MKSLQAVWRALFDSLRDLLPIILVIGFFQFAVLQQPIPNFGEIAIGIAFVVIGLTLFIVLSRQGPLGDFKLLFTQTAMGLGQFLLCLPILVCMVHVALQAADRAAWETARTLGASRVRAFFTVLFEIRFGLMAALLAGYGRIISEVGASMMLGGNIAHYTRNIPTAIALETSKGAFAEGIALGIVLLFLALMVNALLQYVQGKGSINP